MGLVASWHVESSCTRDWTHVLALPSRFLTPWPEGNPTHCLLTQFILFLESKWRTQSNRVSPSLKKKGYLSNLLRAQYLIIPIASKESQAKYTLEYSYCIKQIQRIGRRARMLDSIMPYENSGKQHNLCKFFFPLWNGEIPNSGSHCKD